jgi:hypothetical protein
MSKHPFGSFGNLMRQAQAMQEHLAKLQEQAAGKIVEGSAGGGAVTVKANGALAVVAVTIHAELLKTGDVELLQELIVVATNEALRKAKEVLADEVKGITGGLKLPGLF